MSILVLDFYEVFESSGQVKCSLIIWWCCAREVFIDSVIVIALISFSVIVIAVKVTLVHLVAF